MQRLQLRSLEDEDLLAVARLRHLRELHCGIGTRFTADGLAGFMQAATSEPYLSVDVILQRVS